MVDVVKKDGMSHDKKSKSGFANLKKKLNIPKIYKKLASKLSIHGRHFRSLTSTWNAFDLQSLVSQYELSELLKELCDALLIFYLIFDPPVTMTRFLQQAVDIDLPDLVLCSIICYTADLARSLPRNASEDLLLLQNENFLCDVTVSFSCNSEHHKSECQAYRTIQVHSSLFSKRLNLELSPGERALVRKNLVEQPFSTLQRSVSSRSTLDALLQELCKTVPTDIKFAYDEATKNLTFSCDHCLPCDFVSTVLNFVYGRNASAIKSVANAKSTRASAFTSVCSEDAHCPNLSNQNKCSEDQASFVLKTSNQSSDKKYADDFRNDMKDLLLSANVSGDLKLVFVISALSSFSNHSRSRQPSLCFHCHSFVLAARSKFFRSMIRRHRDRDDGEVCDESHFKTIELDRKVLSPRYFFVVMYAMYTDEVDLQRVIKNIPVVTHRISHESLSAEVRDLMELFHIGRFLDFTGLMQACENALLEHLSVSNLIELLQWSSQGHGSPWLRRQVMRFAKNNFQQLFTNGILYSLSLGDLTEIVSSDFVNSPELDILRAVLKWGEHELLRRIELREPNLVRSHILLNQSSRNFRVSSARRRELVMAGNSEELHDITASLLTSVRLRHVLPANHEVVNSAIKRGVISCPPEHLLEWHHHGGADDSENSCFWIRSKAGPEFRQPRLFAPYISEAKTILKERLLQESTIDASGVKSSRRTPQSSAPKVPPFVKSVVPDALYMVNENRHLSRQSSVRSSFCDKCQRLRVGVTSMATKRLKYIDNRYPVPSPSTASQLLARERSLRQSSWIRNVLQACHSVTVSSSHCCCRASFAETNADQRSSNLCDLCRAEAYVRLIVVREHDLPDVIADILKRPHVYYDADELLAASREAASSSGRSRTINTNLASPTSIDPIPPKRLEKLLRKKSFAVDKRLDPPVSCPLWKVPHHANESSSDLSLSDDSSAEWPFPYTSGQMRDRTQPGSSFWDSDSSIKTPPMRAAVPDVAASADSTLQSLRRARLTSSSSSSSCSSVPCRLVAESQPPESGECVDSSRRFYTGVYHSFSASHKTSAPSYAHYLSLRKPSVSKQRPALSEFHGFTRDSAKSSPPPLKMSIQTNSSSDNRPLELAVKSFPSFAFHSQPSLAAAENLSTTYNDLSNLPETYT